MRARIQFYRNRNYNKRRYFPSNKKFKERLFHFRKRHFKKLIRRRLRHKMKTGNVTNEKLDKDLDNYFRKENENKEENNNIKINKTEDKSDIK